MADKAPVPLDEQDGFTVGWAPFPGGQVAFLSCPIREIVVEGNRGGGKTEILLVKYLAEVGKYGDSWQGIIFRREYKHLDDLVAKSKRLFRKLGVKARWLSSKSDYKWVFETGEELKFRAAKDPEDYWSFHGHEYPFIGWEELTNYPDDRVYEAMRSLNRCPMPGVPRYYVSSCNPFGAGHGWVKARFLLDADGNKVPAGRIQKDDRGNMRVRIHVDLMDNKAMMDNDPEYVQNLEGIQNEALRKAWREGDWDIVVGGFLQGVWDRDVHVVDPFPIPQNWPRWRAMDWGFAKPFSVGWYTKDPDTGVTYRYRELYGWGGKPNTGSRQSADEVAQMILDEEEMERKAGIKFQTNPADTNLWAAMAIRAAGTLVTPAEIMRQRGIAWVQAKKGPGSRVAGAQVVIALLKQHKFKVFSTCTHFIRTVPVLMPDENNWEDVDCWVGETLISTPAGPRRIDAVEVGTLVDTPIGPRAVLRTYLSGKSETVRISLSDGRILEGTPHHKIYVRSSGLVSLDKVQCGDIVQEELSRWKRKLFGMLVSSTRGIQDAFTIIRAYATSRKEERRCTDKCGWMPTVLFQKGTTSTTKITTTTITRLRTLSACLAGRIVRCTTRIGTTLKRSSGSGLHLQKGNAHYPRIFSGVDRLHQSGHFRADTVAWLLRRDTLVRNTVLSVKQRAPWALRRLVRFAEWCSRLRAILPSRRKPVRIVAVGRCVDKKPVFNITVADAHLFYANGILSSNTDMEDHVFDEVKYSLTSRHKIMEEPAKKPEGPRPGTFDWLTQYGGEVKSRSIYRSV